MQAMAFTSLRDLVLHYAARRGWRTQRHVAVVCGLDETALSRFLNGEQDIGARRTHALFQAVGVPVDEYDAAYALLAQAQDIARTALRARLRTEARHGGEAGRGRPASSNPGLLMQGRLAGPAVAASLKVPAPMGWSPLSLPATLDAEADLPATLVAAYFAAEGYTGAQIAAFFEGRP